MEEPQRPYFYYALSQHYQGGVNVIARTSGDPHQWGGRSHRPIRALGLPALTSGHLRQLDGHYAAGRAARGRMRWGFAGSVCCLRLSAYSARSLIRSASARRSSAFASPWASLRGSCFRRFCARRLWSQALESPLDSCWAWASPRFCARNSMKWRRWSGPCWSPSPPRCGGLAAVRLRFCPALDQRQSHGSSASCLNNLRRCAAGSRESFGSNCNRRIDPRGAQR